MYMKTKKNLTKTKPSPAKPPTTILLIAALILIPLIGYAAYNSYLDWRDRENKDYIEKTITAATDKLRQKKPSVNWITRKQCVQPREKYLKLQMYCEIGSVASTQVKEESDIKNVVDNFNEALDETPNLKILNNGDSAYPRLLEGSDRESLANLVSSRLMVPGGLTRSCYVSYKVSKSSGLNNNLQASLICRFDVRTAYYELEDSNN